MDDRSDEQPNRPEDQPRRDPLPPGTVHGSFRVDHRTARLPESVGAGQFANALMVAAGPLEFILDFVQKLGEPPRVVARVVMPPLVANQFLQALRHNVGLYEEQFGAIPPLPLPQNRAQPLAGPGNTAQSSPVASESDSPSIQPKEGDEPGAAGDPPSDNGGYGGYGGYGPGGDVGTGGGIVGAGIEPGTPPPAMRPIQDIYDELKLDDELLSGRYCNAVIVRHTPAEFAFEFITRFMPHSAVSSRVIVSAPNVPSLMGSLEQAVADYQRRQSSGGGGRGELPPPSEN